MNPLDEDKLADAVVANIQERAQWYRTNHILFPWGSDFLHFIAQWDFYNMDKIVRSSPMLTFPNNQLILWQMNRINSKSAETGVIVQYATLNEFFTAVQSTNTTWPVWNGTDFHPYADRPFSYWSGYYSSRPALKWWCRVTEAFQRSAEVVNSLSILAGLRSSSEANKETMQVGRRANGVLTHHDAVSGTSEWYVVLDYGNVRTSPITSLR